MTVSSVVTPLKQYNGNGVTTSFATTFVFTAATDLVVILTDTSDVDTTQILNSDYTVTGGSGSVGTVIMSVAPGSGETLTIQRRTARTQSVDYIENDSFPAESHEGALDKLTLITQELEESIGRSLVLPSTSGISGLVFPTPASDEFIKWNNAATNLESVSLASIDAIVFSGNGMLAYTGTTALTSRTITGTSNEITVTNGDGVSGNPTISLPSALTFTGKTVTNGTFSNPVISIQDSDLTIKDQTDGTKQFKFEASGITTATTRTLTIPNSDGTIALTSPSYVTLGTDGVLPNERVLTAGSGISITDGGAGSTITINQAAGAVLQVVSTQVTATTTSTSTTFADISGLTVSITPSSSSNKILVLIDLSISTDSANNASIRIDRGGSAVGSGVAVGSRFAVGRQSYVNDSITMQNLTMLFLDSPATTSSTTYKVQWICNTAGTNYLNRSRTDTDASNFARGSSSITVMEIKG
jgi:hypothetical protein